MRRFIALSLCLALFHAWAGADLLAAAGSGFPRTAGSPPAGTDERVSGLARALEEALSQGDDADGLAVAVQGLENDVLDLDLPASRSSAARVLLRSVSRPALARGLRSFLLRRASHPDAGGALALLSRWERLVNDPTRRAGLLAGLSGAGDLDSSMGGEASRESSSLAAVSPAPAAARPFAVSAPVLSRAVVLMTVQRAAALPSYRLRPNSLAPPGRSPPSFLHLLPPFPPPAVKAPIKTQPSGPASPISACKIQRKCRDREAAIWHP